MLPARAAAAAARSSAPVVRPARLARAVRRAPASARAAARAARTRGAHGASVSARAIVRSRLARRAAAATAARRGVAPTRSGHAPLPARAASLHADARATVARTACLSAAVGCALPAATHVGRAAAPTRLTGGAAAAAHRCTAAIAHLAALARAVGRVGDAWAVVVRIARPSVRARRRAVRFSVGRCISRHRVVRGAGVDDGDAHVIRPTPGLQGLDHEREKQRRESTDANGDHGATELSTLRSRASFPGLRCGPRTCRAGSVAAPSPRGRARRYRGGACGLE
jgi:hypothetical protein